MSKPVDRATVASMKKAVVRYKRSNLNQSKMRKPQLQSTLRALGVQSVPTVAARKRVKKAPPKRNAAQRAAFKKRHPSLYLTGYLRNARGKWPVLTIQRKASFTNSNN